MDRRGFLKGTFGGVAAGGIIIAAGIPDTQAFVEQVKVGDPVGTAARSTGAEWPDIGDMVFNHKGDVIGVVSRHEFNREMLDATPMGSEWIHVVPGMTRFRFVVDAVGITPTSVGYVRR